MSAKIAAALHHVMSKCGYVQKTGKNAFHGYKYAGEADLLDKLRPAMVEAGLLLIPSGKHVSEIDAHGNVNVTVEYTLVHKDGDVWPEKIIAFGCGNDRAKNGAVGDKGLYKALTGANKYLLFKLFQIETGDDPEADDHDRPESAQDKQKISARAAAQAPRHEPEIVDRIEGDMLARIEQSQSVGALRGLVRSGDWKSAIDSLAAPAQQRVRASYSSRLKALDAVELAGTP